MWGYNTKKKKAIPSAYFGVLAYCCYWHYRVSMVHGCHKFIKKVPLLDLLFLPFTGVDRYYRLYIIKLRIVLPARFAFPRLVSAVDTNVSRISNLHIRPDHN
mmetsp:Transcript_52589/g.63398  ORF Transcript_52589/g.63398 Transcript_52589/m.63398 type:complete len:102 (-) Transcript_52589:278-583(-)